MKRRLDAEKRWAGEAAVMASSGGSLVGSPSSGGVVEAAAVRGGWLVLACVSKRPSAWVAMASLVKEMKSVMAARTGSGRRHNQRTKRTSMLAEAPAASGGRRHRDLISVRASDRRWSPSSWLDKSRIIWTLFSVDGENSFRRNILRSLYSTALLPFASSQADICGKSESGMAAKTWDDVIFFNLNWTSAWRNQMAAATVENVGSLRWWMAGSMATGEAGSAGEEVVASAGMAKARA